MYVEKQGCMASSPDYKPVFTARRYAERGYATECRLSVCLSV